MRHDAQRLHAGGEADADDVGDDREHVALDWLAVGRMIRTVVREAFVACAVEFLDRLDRLDEIVGADRARDRTR